ncbi:type 4b pilus protein PilO2, partial [Salmonella enterica]|nr:type 4b pilus protein PilO2 [Salmonella enterica]
VYCLDAEASRYVFLATVDGLPSVMGDVAGTAEETREALQRFLTFNTAPEGGWTIYERRLCENVSDRRNGRK